MKLEVDPKFKDLVIFIEDELAIAEMGNDSLGLLSEEERAMFDAGADIKLKITMDSDLSALFTNRNSRNSVTMTIIYNQ